MNVREQIQMLAFQDIENFPKAQHHEFYFLHERKHGNKIKWKMSKQSIIGEGAGRSCGRRYSPSRSPLVHEGSVRLYSMQRCRAL
uniref:Uncharacterized protein n=1 Tax=Setaria italica TaxID=4555 RepID=K3XR99_SETIT